MPIPENSELSERELEILRLVATGASNKEIALQLFISSNTVKVHLRNIFSKIDAASRTEAAMYAVRIGLVQGGPVPLPPKDSPLTPSLPAEQAAVAAEPLPAWRRWPLWVTLLAGLILVSIGGIAYSLGRRSTPQPTIMTPASSPSQSAAFLRWHTLAPLPTARRGLALTAFENRLFAIGGETSQGITGALDVYNVDTDTWTALTSKPTPVTNVFAAVINGLIYIPGGRHGPMDNEITSQLEIYDPVLDQWHSGASLPYPISAYALQAFEGRLYLFGGWNGETYLSTVLMYDPALDNWQERTPMPTARAFSGAAVAGGKIYVIGGQAGDTPLVVNEVYTPARDNTEGKSPWETGFPIPDPRQGMQVATIADAIYVLGGTNQSNSNYGLIYIPQSNTWQSLEPSPQPLGVSFGLVSIGPQLYITGGKVDDLLSDQNLTYQALITLSIPIIIK